MKNIFFSQINPNTPYISWALDQIFIPTFMVRKNKNKTYITKYAFSHGRGRNNGEIKLPTIIWEYAKSKIILVKQSSKTVWKVETSAVIVVHFNHFHVDQVFVKIRTWQNTAVVGQGKINVSPKSTFFKLSRVWIRKKTCQLVRLLRFHFHGNPNRFRVSRGIYISW